MKKILLLAGSAFLLNAGFAQKEINIQDIEEVTVMRNGNDSSKKSKTYTIKLKGDKAKEEKFTIEVDGSKIKLNGKDIANLKDVDVTIGESNITVNGRRLNFANGNRPRMPQMNRTMTINGSKAMLGITMEKADNGVKINSITEGSGAEKAGLKEGDVIIKLNDTEIKTQADVTKFMEGKKPGEEVTVHINRDGKNLKEKIKLTERKEIIINRMDFDGDFNLDGNMGDMKGFKFEEMPMEMDAFKFGHGGQSDGMDWAEGFLMNIQPKIGLDLTETEDGKGLAVIDVDQESVAAKAGLQKGDIITKVNGNPINAVSDIKKEMKELAKKPAIVTYTRAGKENTTELKVPKKLKKVSL